MNAVGNVAPTALFWPDFIAAKQGFYAREGLAVETIFVGSVSAAVQQTIGGSIDVAFTTAETAIRAIDRGGDVTILGETVKKWPYSFMAAKDIKNGADPMATGRRFVKGEAAPGSLNDPALQGSYESYNP